MKRLLLNIKFIAICISLLTFICLFYSCKESAVEWEIDKNEQDLLVVEGIITNEYLYQQIEISKLVYELSDQPEPVSGATVVVTDGEDIIWLVEDTLQNGLYKTTERVQAVYGKRYWLGVEYEGQKYSAHDYMLPVQRFNPLKYKSDGELFVIDSVCDEYALYDPAMYRLFLDWSHVQGYEHLHEDSCKARLNYYSLSTIDVSQIFKPDKELVKFPRGTIIIEKKYSLSPRHESFIRSMLAESEWRGGFFDESPANVNTNLSHGAIGFFGACTVTSDTIVVF